MASGSRFLFTVSVVLVVLGSGSLLQPKWLADLGLDWWNLPDLYRRGVAAELRLAELDKCTQFILQRIETKCQIVDAVIAGQMTLKEAAAQFRYLNDCYPEVEVSEMPYPGATPEEKCARQVIGWVRGRMADNPKSYIAGLVEQLEAELDEYLCRGANAQRTEKE